MSNMPMENESFGRRASYTPTDKYGNSAGGLPLKKVAAANSDKFQRAAAYDHNSNYPGNSFQTTDATSDGRCRRCPLLPIFLFIGVLLLILVITLPIVLTKNKTKVQISNETVPLKGSVMSQLHHSVLDSSFVDFLRDRCEQSKVDHHQRSADTDRHIFDQTGCDPETLKSRYVVAKLSDMMQQATGKTKLCSTVSCGKVQVDNLGMDEEFLNFDFQVDLNRNKHGKVVLDDLSPSEMIITTRDVLDDQFKTIFPGFALKDAIVEFELKELCQLDAVRCSDEIMAIWATEVTEVDDASRSLATDVPRLAVEPAEGEFSVDNMKGNVTTMITCHNHGFECFDKKRIINKRQLCDGVSQCDDGSDEAQCESCRTSFSCKDQQGHLKCLRGSSLCDGVKDCPDGSDEKTHCRSNCSSKEHRCKSGNICIPFGWVCDGDIHCPDGDDESSCMNAETCTNDAQFCSANNSCTASWYICDGVSHCPNAEDELNCTCHDCSADHLALCQNPGHCIGRKHVCDGVKDCQHEEDEINCPGFCTMETDPEQVQCPDNMLYPRNAVCTGRVPSCRENCPQCDANEAFQCVATQACIERNKICDGKADCLDSSDENETLCTCNTTESFVCNATASELRCIPMRYRCDGYHDCLGSADELDCESCFNNPEAFYCNSTKTCFPKTARCNGEVDCPDYSDEDHCTCTECKNQIQPTFMCKARNRCLLRRHVCNPLSPHHCPGRVAEDEMYCAPIWDPFEGLKEQPQ